jgi:hypothetical protein
MTKFSDQFEPLAREFEKRLKQSQSTVIKDYPWDNKIWHSDRFAWAHLERYYTDKVSVLHFVIMPNRNSRSPIFGFDIIEISGVLTGMFLDTTPVPMGVILPKVGVTRERPDWADFFSEQFVCVKPNSIADAFESLPVLDMYMTLLPGTCDEDQGAIQQLYIDGQRRNPQTFKMLKSHIGEEQARKFIDNILFPNII